MSFELKDRSAKTLIVAIMDAELAAGRPLEIVGGEMSDDRPPRAVTIVNKDGCDWQHYGGEIEGLFLG